MSGQIAASRLHDALDQILNDETVAVVLIATDGHKIGARSFGDVDEALWATNEMTIALEMQTYEPLPEVYAH